MNRVWKHGLTLSASLLGLVLIPPAQAQDAPARSPPTSVTLTQDQWACLETRLPALKSAASDLVRVPLSPCGAGQGLRGPGASNATAGASNPTAGVPRTAPSGSTPPTNAVTTRAPLYLTKDQLTCVETQMASLKAPAQALSTVDLQTCRVGAK